MLGRLIWRVGHRAAVMRKSVLNPMRMRRSLLNLDHPAGCTRESLWTTGGVRIEGRTIRQGRGGTHCRRSDRMQQGSPYWMRHVRNLNDPHLRRGGLIVRFVTSFQEHVCLTRHGLPVWATRWRGRLSSLSSDSQSLM